MSVLALIDVPCIDALRYTLSDGSHRRGHKAIPFVFGII